MMATPRSRARTWRRVAALAMALVLCFHFLPNDNHLRLALRYLAYTSRQQPFSPHQLLAESVPYPVDLVQDVALIIKSGYGTKDRLPGTLKFVGGDDHDKNGLRFESILLVADFATQPGGHYNCCAGLELPVHDVVLQTIHSAPLADTAARPRHVENYARLQAALAKNDDKLAQSLSHDFGWQLDAMKASPGFISSLELAYKTFPDKKWYLLADDDTYLVRPSLRQFLGQFSSTCAHYLGNAVGGWEGRFAHGGSGVIISQAAMHLLFKENPRVVAAAHHMALTTGMGDSLLSNTLMQIGVYVEEEHSLLFNGETPATTKIKEDRFCYPILSFHGLRAPDETLAVDRVFRQMPQRATRWKDIWHLYGGPNLGDSNKIEPLQEGWDHVGRLDEHTTSVENVDNEQACLKLCVSKTHSKSCLAWTWEAERRVCHMSPWMIVGDKAEGRTTGLNLPRVKRMAKACGDV
ncbi:hypothetical protein SEUCBS139899_002575 [Sporothrix eucalyptigena]|uniref:N-acetylgalactosaminide beta-1,3-galactosyltransferase n=1 Tax=Sporothrix eucalyptigena TaxID=1812306 RepID=A0ABP0BK62_9PEZI